jgi:hypothetical protein
MWHQVEHNYKTMSNKKYISKLFYYTQIMINILVIFFAQYKLQEKNWFSGYNLPPTPQPKWSKVQSLCQIFFFSP